VIDTTLNLPAIRTSDAIRYKRCRRYWDFTSGMRRHLEPANAEYNINLWQGTAMHFALEDYHGYNRFKDPCKALEAFYHAFDPDDLPLSAEEALAQTMGMLEYYLKWLKQRDEFRTVWIDGKPQVEVRFQIYIPELHCFYQGTFDRIVEDSDSRVWVTDYKSAKIVDTAKLETDQQISRYSWAAERWYDIEIEGVLYQQFRKAVPQPPQTLKNGELSTNKQQKTTHTLYMETLLERFGHINKIPSKYFEMLEHLSSMESFEGDYYIRWDRVRRNEAAKAKEYEYILMEGSEMLNPELPIYPNSTRDCAWECGFRTVCISMNDGSDWEYMLDEGFRKQVESDDWRNRIKWPKE